MSKSAVSRRFIEASEKRLKELFEQRFRRRRVLARSLDHAQHVLAARVVHSRRCEFVTAADGIRIAA